jgi:RIO-like serine/threonine protein kinase
MSNFTKIQQYNKVSADKAFAEYKLQKDLSTKYDFIPKIYSLTLYSTHSEMLMEKIDGLNLFEKFSDDPEDIPQSIWNQMRTIVNTLYYEQGIQYIDITPYNFMIDSNDKLWIIDFGHAYYSNHNKQINWFLEQFIFDGINQFNPDFA